MGCLLCVVCISTLALGANEFYIDDPNEGATFGTQTTEIDCAGGRNPEMAECYTVTVEQNSGPFGWAIVGQSNGSSDNSGAWETIVECEGGLQQRTTGIFIYGSDGVLDQCIQINVI
jgi:hypothetical protein